MSTNRYKVTYRVPNSFLTGNHNADDIFEATHYKVDENGHLHFFNGLTTITSYSDSVWLKVDLLSDLSGPEEPEEGKVQFIDRMPQISTPNFSIYQGPKLTSFNEVDPTNKEVLNEEPWTYGEKDFPQQSPAPKITTPGLVKSDKDEGPVYSGPTLVNFDSDTNTITATDNGKVLSWDNDIPGWKIVTANDYDVPKGTGGEVDPSGYRRVALLWPAVGSVGGGEEDVQSLDEPVEKPVKRSGFGPEYTAFADKLTGTIQDWVNDNSVNLDDYSVVDEPPIETDESWDDKNARWANNVVHPLDAPDDDFGHSQILEVKDAPDE